MLYVQTTKTKHWKQQQQQKYKLTIEIKSQKRLFVLNERGMKLLELCLS